MRYGFFVFFFVNVLRAGTIVTTSNLDHIEQEAKVHGDQLFVLFDVDATLIVPDDAILRAEGKSLFKRLMGCHQDRDLFRDTRRKAPHSLVDPQSVCYVEDLQSRNIPVIALTAAPAEITGVEPGLWRVNELIQYGFDFSKSFPEVECVEFPEYIHPQYQPLFKSGVLYSSLVHSKGEVLVSFLQKMGLSPKKVVFVDDERDFVESVVSSLEKIGIDCLGIHYTAANESPRTLDLDHALFQIKHFVEQDVWISDQRTLHSLNNY